MFVKKFIIILVTIKTNNDHYRQMAYQQFTSLKRKAYPVEKSHQDNAISLAEELIERDFPQPAYPDLVFRTIGFP